mgnify:CR=1 FL=1
MSKYPKRTMVTLLPEWEPLLDQLKKEQFYNDTRAEMFRYIISRGLDSLEAEKKNKRTLCGGIS